MSDATSNHSETEDSPKQWVRKDRVRISENTGAGPDISGRAEIKDPPPTWIETTDGERIDYDDHMLVTLFDETEIHLVHVDNVEQL